MNLTLVRYAYLHDVTLGELYVDALRFFTLEPPWVEDPAHVGGKPFRSCVPDGVYNLLAHNSKEHPNTFVLQNIALGVVIDAPVDSGMRTEVLIHTGNVLADTRGCILLGSSFSTIGGTPTVLRSVAAMDALRRVLGPLAGPHIIDIRPTAGTQEIKHDT